jgi:Fe-S-cluster-containing dehydrogenase component/formate-dependent nitrite reductase membrane component NrfD
MAKFGFLIDDRKCIGCHACTVACKQEHDVPLGDFRTWVKYIEKGQFPHTQRHFSVMRCNHCERPPCVEICPVTALYKRPDGIVDFDPQVCIGCKACMGACPYDALFINPDTGAANKCNFCAHRIEVQREPPCVTVCPEQAIVMGDLDDPGSNINQLIRTERATVRAPEKATRPQLFYVEADAASLKPLAAPPADQYLWSRPRDSVMPLAPGERALEPTATRTYDVSHAQPWGWKVSAYLYTKSVASGGFWLPALLYAWHRDEAHWQLLLSGSFMALFFLAVTGVLLIWDLKRPHKFLNLFLRPQWKSWLTRGTFIISGYGAVLTAFLALAWHEHAPSPPWHAVAYSLLIAAGVSLGVLSAAYTGWLFQQCEARDLWHSHKLPTHLVVQAGLAAAALLLFSPAGAGGIHAFERWTAFFIAVEAIAFLPDKWNVHRKPRASAHLREASALLTRGLFKVDFWGGVLVAGHLVPLVLLLTGTSFGIVLAVLLSQFGLMLYEHIFVQAGQAVPIS